MESNAEHNRIEANISRKSTLTLGLAIAAIIGAAGFGWNVSNTMASIESNATQNKQELKDLIRDGDEDSKDLRSDIDSAQLRIEAILETRWSIDNEAENAARNAIANPGIRYADPKNPGDYFYVKPNTP